MFRQAVALGGVVLLLLGPATADEGRKPGFALRKQRDRSDTETDRLPS